MVSRAQNGIDYESIVTWGADLSLGELISMYDKRELSALEVQQNCRWDRKKANLFIDSILNGIPIPSVILIIVNDTKTIVDGYQRIRTLYDYVVTGTFSKDNRVFKLSNSEQINRKWRGKTFKELDLDEQTRIKESTVHTIILEQKNSKYDDSIIYEIFERYNSNSHSGNKHKSQ